MIKIQEVVHDIMHADDEFLTAVTRCYANLSAYAKQIQPQVEAATKKRVHIAGIVVALSRESKQIGTVHPLVQDIHINNITTKSPLIELVFQKNPQSLAKLTALYARTTTGADVFFTITFSTNEVTVICSSAIKSAIDKIVKIKPLMIQENLASLSIFLDPHYYYLPNITYSLIRRIAQKHIPLAETITTRTEIIFVFDKKYIGEMVALFHS